MSRVTTLATTIALVMLAAGQASAVVGIFDGQADIGDQLGANDPAFSGSATYTAGALIDGQTVDLYEVLAGGSDWWSAREAGHVVFNNMVDGDWRITANVALEDGTGDGVDGWMKAGVFSRKDLGSGAGAGWEKEVNAITAATWANNGSFQYREADNVNMQHTAAGSYRPFAVALQRSGDDFTGYICDPFGDWTEVNTMALPNMGAEPAMGLFVTAHRNTVGDPAEPNYEKGYFWGVEITTDLNDPLPAPVHLPSLQGEIPWRAGDPVDVPETLTPVQGGWSVLEVVNNGNMGSVSDAVASIEGGMGDRLVYNLMGPINIGDHEVNAKNFPGDGGYGVAYENLAVGAPWPAPNNVDHLAFIARGQIEIPTTGDWTFYINSDDGEQLSIDNGALVIGSEGWQDNNFGTVHLTAGVHDIEVIHREATGGGDLEAAAAMGATTDLRAFTLIGSGDPGHDAYVDYSVPGTTDITIEMSLPDAHSGLGNLAQAMGAIEAGRVAQTNVVATDTKINFHDPEDGGTGSIGGDDPYLINTEPTEDPPYDGKDNNFALLATGAINIAEDGLYYFGFQSDDGAALTIPGQEWIEIVDAADWNESHIDETDPSILYRDGGTGNSRTVASIELTAGSHPFQFLTWEGAGGAYCEVFGSDTLGMYDLLMTGDGVVSMVPAAAAALKLVPEPSTWVMLLSVAALGLYGFRRRRK